MNTEKTEDNKITFGGKELILKNLNGNDWVDLEELLGSSIKVWSKTMAEDGGMSMRDIRSVLYIAIRRASNEDPQITLQWVGSNYNLEMSDLVKKIINFLTPKESRKKSGFIKELDLFGQRYGWNKKDILTLTLPERLGLIRLIEIETAKAKLAQGKK